MIELKDVNSLYYILDYVEGMFPNGTLDKDMEQINKMMRDYATNGYYERLLLSLKNKLGETASHVVNVAIEEKAKRDMPELFLDKKDKH